MATRSVGKQSIQSKVTGAVGDQDLKPDAFRYIDIGVNLTDPVFRGIYHGREKHEDDTQAMLDRAAAAGVKSMVVTGGSLEESRLALEVAQKYGLYATVGCHPTRSSEFDKHPEGPEDYLKLLDNLIQGNLTGKGRAVAVGECGLDYDRLHFASQETQRRHFRSQLALAKNYHLPLFLHLRAAHADFVQILREEGLGEDGGRAVGARGGVVHSFTGTSEEALELISMGFYISINGCGLKTEENLATVEAIPFDKILLETDAPWCSMTSTQASHRHLSKMPASLLSVYFPPSTKPERFSAGKAVKGRNEPIAIGGVAWVVSTVKGQDMDSLVKSAWKNTVELFGLEELEA